MVELEIDKISRNVQLLITCDVEGINSLHLIYR